MHSDQAIYLKRPHKEFSTSSGIFFFREREREGIILQDECNSVKDIVTSLTFKWTPIKSELLKASQVSGRVNLTWELTYQKRAAKRAITQTCIGMGLKMRYQLVIAKTL